MRGENLHNTNNDIFLSWDIVHEPAKDLYVTVHRDVHPLERVAYRGLSEKDKVEIMCSLSSFFWFITC